MKLDKWAKSWLAEDDSRTMWLGEEMSGSVVSLPSCRCLFMTFGPCWELIFLLLGAWTLWSGKKLPSSSMSITPRRETFDLLFHRGLFWSGFSSRLAAREKYIEDITMSFLLPLEQLPFTCSLQQPQANKANIHAEWPALHSYSILPFLSKASNTNPLSKTIPIILLFCTADVAAAQNFAASAERWIGAMEERLGPRVAWDLLRKIASVSLVGIGWVTQRIKFLDFSNPTAENR